MAIAAVIGGVALGALGNIITNGPAYVQWGSEQFDENAQMQRKEAIDAGRKLRTGAVGPSEAQRAKWLSQQSRVNDAKAANQQAGLAQQAAASGQNRGGAYFANQQAATKDAFAATAQTAGKIEDISAQNAAQERNTLRAVQDRERERMWKLWGIGGAPTPVAQAFGSIGHDMVQGGMSKGKSFHDSMAQGVKGTPAYDASLKKKELTPEELKKMYGAIPGAGAAAGGEAAGATSVPSAP